LTRPISKRSKEIQGPKNTTTISEEYFRLRDFEYAQPLYDLAFLIEVDALAKGNEVPKFRTFSLWRAGYSLDGYGSTIDRWLEGTLRDEELDYVPSVRIRQYLTNIRLSGTVPELHSYRTEQYDRCLRLRSVRGLGPNKIAATLLPGSSADDWLHQSIAGLDVDPDRVARLYHTSNAGPWQTAHIVPPLFRFLNKLQEHGLHTARWELSGISDPFKPVDGPVSVATNGAADSLGPAVEKALEHEKHFSYHSQLDDTSIHIRHQMGWGFRLQLKHEPGASHSISELAQTLDPLASIYPSDLLADLHLHTAWSDGNASVNTMALAVAARGLQYFAVTDHSRSSKLQGGLTPLLWIRQANALTLAMPVCPVMHGIEVDILRDGALDLPHSILAAADLVVASVHSNWSDDAQTNTDRLFRAIESGCIDILAHPTSAVVGTPGVPDYLRQPAKVLWTEVFKKCAAWRVAVELNCFPSRLDLPLELLEKAIDAGCAISIGSDSHSRSHLINLRFGDAALRRLNECTVLNRLSYEELSCWIRKSRQERQDLPTNTLVAQATLDFQEDKIARRSLLRAHIQPPRSVPVGSRVVGIDLTAGDKATGVAVLNEFFVETCSLFSDEEILRYIEEQKPGIVSIDSPLGLPGGGDTIDPKAGIMRVAEHDLASIGIPAYPALIDSMEKLTLRGIRLRRAIERLSPAPRVIESYPGAAQDILCIPRKQKSLGLLREGLRRLGLTGPGLETRSHDEMDAITSAIVGRYFEAGLFEPMGIHSEAQLIVPKVAPLKFDQAPIICLAGKTGAGKSVVARYLSVFYGFHWVRTRSVIRDMLLEDIGYPPEKKLFEGVIDPETITEMDLQRLGAVILDKYKQVPLRHKLTDMIAHLNGPVVVDSIRDAFDVDRESLRERPRIIWFVDCTDLAIRDRLAKKAKLGQKRPMAGSPVDRTASTIRAEADHVIPNSGSLEDLRWSVDDTLFTAIHLSITPTGLSNNDSPVSNRESS
jgi:histidinol phosphatase-like PHP family hydrolase/predicted nuclease with RNAse H fold/dephospho-CoA kinase